MSFHFNKSDPGHTPPGYQMMKYLQKNFCQSISETPTRRKEKTSQPISKLFTLHANAWQGRYWSHKRLKQK